MEMNCVSRPMMKGEEGSPPLMEFSMSQFTCERDNEEQVQQVDKSTGSRGSDSTTRLPAHVHALPLASWLKCIKLSKHEAHTAHSLIISIGYSIRCPKMKLTDTPLYAALGQRVDPGTSHSRHGRLILPQVFNGGGGSCSHSLSDADGPIKWRS
jgi:hypothetical protein